MDKALQKCTGYLEKKTLNCMASKALKSGNFSRIIITKVNNQSLVIQVSKRKPWLLVKADKLRFLTKSGIIYGRAPASYSAKLPVISGVLAKEEVSTNHSDHSININGEQQSRLDRAAAIYKLTQAHAVDVSEISYNKYRGFYLTTKESGTSVLLGHAPFAKKLHVLRKFLAKSETQEK